MKTITIDDHKKFIEAYVTSSTIQEVAQRTKLSLATVKNRTKLLRNQNVRITLRTPVVDFKELEAYRKSLAGN